MGTHHALFIAVEAYRDPEFPAVKYAGSDAAGIRAALEAHGFDPSRSDLLLGPGACLSSVEAALRDRVRRLKPPDTLVLYYSGHACQRQGRTFLTCHDTRSADLEATSLPLALLFASLRNSPCGRFFLFFDPGHPGWPAEGDLQDIRPGIAHEEMEALLSPADSSFAFAACGHHEKSYASARLGRGIWAHHLIETFRGAERDALERGRYLTAPSLQAHLARAVPKSVRTLLAGIPVQTPMAWGDLSKPVRILDFKAVFDARDEAESVELKSLEHAFFRGAKSDSVRRLTGWKKGFRVPDAASRSSTAFIQSIGSEDLKARFDAFHDRIRKHLGYKRSDLTVGEGPGSFSCITPDFTLTLTLDQDKDEPSRYLESLVISEIRNPATVASPGFGAVFDSEFDEVVLEYSRPFDIGKIVDAIEAMDNPKVGVEYPPDARECTVTFRSLNVRLRFSGTTLVYAFASKAVVHRIMDAVRNAPRVLGLDRMAS